jgi:drug/metabolite transporter (DMT)-like permease
MVKWGLFLLISLIWGSSFLLMAAGMESFTPWQVAAARLFFGGLVLSPLAMGALKRIPRNQLKLVILSGFLASFFPAFLFCIAETRLESSFAGMLNALTPVFVIIVGALFYQSPARKQQVWGILISFTGCICLFLSKNTSTGDLLFSGFVLLATICYGFNVNMVSKKLTGISAVDLIAISFTIIAIPALFILIFTNTFSANFTARPVLISAGASILLGVFGTALGNILFYILMQKAGRIFASTVTYGIPFVAIFFGWLVYRETLNVYGWLSMLVILTGIFVANMRKT